MTLKETTQKITQKTYTAFVVIVLLSITIALIDSAYLYSKNVFQPQYKINQETQTDTDDKIHKIYASSFILNKTANLFLKNILLISLTFFVFTYSVVINKGDLITSDGKKVIFANISSAGIYLLIFLTVLYFFALELFIPAINTKLDDMKNKTSQSIFLLEKGNFYYHNKKYNDCFPLYSEYMDIIHTDETIKLRLREIKNKIKAEEFEEKKRINKIETSSIDTTISDSIKDYSQLAEIYFQKKDYLAAWYYYQYVAESDSAKKNEALNKISIIKKVFTYDQSMLLDGDPNKKREIGSWLVEKEQEIKDIYILKRRAEKFLHEKDYQKAFFIYRDILKINPKLRDIIDAKNDTYVKLTNLAVELSEIESVKFYPSKDNFVFMASPRQLIYIGSIIKTPNKFYFFDIKMIDFDDNFNVKTRIESPYGGTKSDKVYTTYCFSLENKNIEYYPTLLQNNSSKKQRNPEYIFQLPVDMNILYNFSYDYEKTLNFSLVKLFKFKNFTIKKDESSNFSIGFNNNFIKTAIADKISRLFLFFYINIICISLAWRFRSTYIANIPMLHYFFMITIPFFLYILITMVQSIVTSFYSILSLTVNFGIMLTICFTLNIIVMIGSIIFIAGSSTE